MSTIVKLRYLVKYCIERPCIKWVLITIFWKFIDWLNESFLNNSSPPNKEIFSFSEGKKTNASEESIAEVFLRNSTVTLTYVKNTHKTHECQKKKKVAVIQPEHFKELEKQLNGSALQNGCSEKFEKIIRKTFDFTDKNTPPRRCFLCNFRKYFRTNQGSCFWNYPGK